MKIIATAIEINSKNSLLSSRFGKAKYYAFFDGQTLTIEKNNNQGGASLLKWLQHKHVTHLLLKEIGKIPCAWSKKQNITLLYPKQKNQPKLQEMIQLYFQLNENYPTML
jgi:predicted Fe-Mo cluster-binding NifX family protein